MEENKDFRSAIGQTSSQLFFSLLGGFLMLATGFFAGWYWQSATTETPVNVMVSEQGKLNSSAAASNRSNADEKESGEQSSEVVTDPTDCLFVGSKNSDKYHIPGSGNAARIKESNLVCFQSEEEAKEAGYEPGTLQQ